MTCLLHGVRKSARLLRPLGQRRCKTKHGDIEKQLFYIYIYVMFLDQGPKVPPNGIPPHPPNLGVEDFPSSFLLLSLLPSAFPSSFLLFLLPFSFLSFPSPSLPFFLSSFPPSFEAMSAAHHHRGEEMLCNTIAIK